MFSHRFIFVPGHWLGEGKILLSMVEEELPFKMSWSVHNSDVAGTVSCSQQIQIQGLSEGMHNELKFAHFENKSFSVVMENQNVGQIEGKGIVDEKTIGWEFRNPDSEFEGFETYHLQPDGSYQMHGEYVTSDQFRTQIEARIWPEPAPSPLTSPEDKETQ